MTELKTERLILRPLAVDDAEPIARLAGEWDVAAMTERIPFPFGADAAMDWVQAVKDEIVFGMHLDGTFIGCAGLAPKDDGNTEIGYWIGKPWWGRGFATEAGRAVVAHGFLELGITNLVSAHFEDNPASANVLQKLGFEPTGVTWERYCSARKGSVNCVGYELSLSHAQQLGII